jgi:hypothetical protein
MKRNQSSKTQTQTVTEADKVEAFRRLQEAAMTPAEKVDNLVKLGLPERANLVRGQDPRSVLYQAPATEPHNYTDALKEGHLLPHPSGRFVRP